VPPRETDAIWSKSLELKSMNAEFAMEMEALAVRFFSAYVCSALTTLSGLDLNTEEVIGISAGLLAVIIIASVIVCAAVGIFGGKKGYDIWLNHKNNMQGANTNPLYKDDGMTGTNPLYSS
jgi:hypothetical protein